MVLIGFSDTLIPMRSIGIVGNTYFSPEVASLSLSYSRVWSWYPP